MHKMVVKAVTNLAKLGTFLENVPTKQNMEGIKGGEETKAVLNVERLVIFQGNAHLQGFWTKVVGLVEKKDTLQESAQLEGMSLRLAKEETKAVLNVERLVILQGNAHHRDLRREWLQ